MTGKWLCEAMKVGRMTFRISVLVAAICIVGVVVAVVMTGRDGSLADGLALLAVATLVVAWRHRRTERDSFDRLTGIIPPTSDHAAVHSRSCR